MADLGVHGPGFDRGYVEAISTTTAEGNFDSKVGSNASSTAAKSNAVASPKIASSNANYGDFPLNRTVTLEFSSVATEKTSVVSDQKIGTRPVSKTEMNKIVIGLLGTTGAGILKLNVHNCPIKDFKERVDQLIIDSMRGS